VKTQTSIVSRVAFSVSDSILASVNSTYLLTYILGTQDQLSFDFIVPLREFLLRQRMRGGFFARTIVPIAKEREKESIRLLLPQSHATRNRNCTPSPSFCFGPGWWTYDRTIHNVIHTTCDCAGFAKSEERALKTMHAGGGRMG